MGTPSDRNLPLVATDDGDDEPFLDPPQRYAHFEHVSPTLDRSNHTPGDATLDRKPGDGPRSSLQSSRSASTDLELENMRHDDPLYANGIWASSKQSNWTDTGQHSSTTNPPVTEKEARRLGNKHFIQKTLINALLIGLWYILSISMSVYNKWMFSPGNLDFHFPLFSTSVHMLIQFLLASSILYLFPRFRPERPAPDPHDSEQDPRPLGTETSRKPLMTPWFYLTRIASCGAVTGLDIGLGNTSLKFISLTFFTMVKSSTLGFVLGFAILFRLESPSWKIGGIIAVMTLGVILMVSGETAFDALGFALLMLASFFSGLRWSLTQILLRRTPATSNPFSTLFFLTPVMFVILFILAIPTETFSDLANGLDTLAQKKGLALGMLIVLFPGCIAFCMTAAEFALLKRTSVVTLSVCGIFKEVLTITAAGFIFGDELTPINISGLLITIMAIAVYNWTRMRRMKRMEISKARGGSTGGGGRNSAGSSASINDPATAAGATGAQAFDPMNDTQPHVRKSTDGAEGEAAPMLMSALLPGKREDAAPANQDNDDDDDADDVIMIEGGETHGSRLEQMREPVRAFLQQNRVRPSHGYAAL